MKTFSIILKKIKFLKPYFFFLLHFIKSIPELPPIKIECHCKAITPALTVWIILSRRLLAVRSKLQGDKQLSRRRRQELCKAGRDRAIAGWKRCDYSTTFISFHSLSAMTISPHKAGSSLIGWRSTRHLDYTRITFT